MQCTYQPYPVRMFTAAGKHCGCPGPHATCGDRHAWRPGQRRRAHMRVNAPMHDKLSQEEQPARVGAARRGCHQAGGWMMRPTQGQLAGHGLPARGAALVARTLPSLAVCLPPRRLPASLFDAVHGNLMAQPKQRVLSSHVTQQKQRVRRCTSK